MSEEKISKVSTHDQNSSDTKSKPKSKRCCCIGLGVMLFIFLIFVFIRFSGFFGGSKADVDVSKLIPASSDKYTTAPSAKPSAKVSEDTQPKDNQPATSESEPANNSLDTGISKQEQIDYFIKVAIRDSDNGNAESPLRKWGKNNVSLQVTGQNSSMSDQCINDTISSINSISKTMKLSRTAGAGDIKLELTDRATLEARGFTVGGFFVYSRRVGSSFNITGANAYAATDYWLGEDLLNCQIIRHELTHTIGLPYNTSGVLSIFGPPTSITNEYQDIDKQMIKILLNTGITSGLGEAEVRAFLAKANW